MRKLTVSSGRPQESIVTSTTPMSTRHSSEALESAFGLALLWLVPAVAFIVALFIG